MAAVACGDAGDGARHGPWERMDRPDSQQGDHIGRRHWIRSSELSAQVYAEIRWTPQAGRRISAAAPLTGRPSKRRRRQKRHSEECLSWNARAADPDDVHWALAGGSQVLTFSTPYFLINFKDSSGPGRDPGSGSTGRGHALSGNRLELVPAYRPYHEAVGFPCPAGASRSGCRCAELGPTAWEWKRRRRPLPNRSRAVLIRAAGRFPGSWEDFPWGERVAKVGKKVFAFLGADDAEERSVSLKLPESCHQALTLDCCEPTGYGLGRAGWVTVHLDRPGCPGADVLVDWLDESFRAVAPKRLITELDGRS